MSAKAAPLHATQVLPCANIVGESLIWDDRDNRLYWVDMLGHRIHAYDPATKQHQSWETPGMVTSIGLRAGAGYVVGLQKTLTLWQPGGTFAPLVTLEPDLPDNRLNEGVVGPDGCFWVGTMQNNVDAQNNPVDQTAKTGQLWRVAPDGQATCMSPDKFWGTNTFGWLGDQLIVGDTGENTLYSYAWPPVGDRLSARKPFLAGYAHGLPDGSCVDQSGSLWNCRVVGGAQVIQITPDGPDGPDGTVQNIIQTPCTWPTSCVFGGETYDTLYITSARFTMEDAHLQANPSEGSLFACTQTGATGKPCYRFGD